MSFSHLEAGTPESAWAEAGVGELPVVSGDDAPGTDTVLVLVLAHPDDETLAATGLIRGVLEAGGRVELLVCTAGEASHPDSPTHTPARLGRLRRAEMEHAVRELGSGHEARLRLHQEAVPDGAVAEHLDAVRTVLEQILDAVPADARPLLAGHYRHDGHADHDALGRLAADVAAERALVLYELPLWYWHWAEPSRDARWRHWARWPLPAGADRVRARALLAHASQTRPLSEEPGDEAILAPGMLEHFARPADVVRRTGPDSADSARAGGIFDALYREHEDPWGYLSAWYEQRKRALTLALLPRPGYGTVVEAGSSIGVLTQELAERAEHVVGLEASAVALERARGRLGAHPGVELAHAVLPRDWDAAVSGHAPVDLVVVSELGYFLHADEVLDLVDRAEAALGAGGQLVLCHWRHPVEGWPLDGDRVHALVGQDPRFTTIASHRERDVRVDVLARAAAADRWTVVVPARDEQELLPRALEALGRAADRWEQLHGQGTVVIVVAVDRCTDDTVARAREAARRDGRVHVLEREDNAEVPGTVGAARDAGVRHGAGLSDRRPRAAGRRDELWVASTDADSVVPEDWLLAQAELAAGHDGPLLLGTVEPRPEDLDPRTRERWAREYAHREGHPHVHGANLALPWSRYVELGGFPHVALHEDVGLAEAARAAGVEVIATDRTRVTTSGRREGRTDGGFAGFLRGLGGD